MRSIATNATIQGGNFGVNYTRGTDSLTLTTGRTTTNSRVNTTNIFTREEGLELALNILTAIEATEDEVEFISVRLFG